MTTVLEAVSENAEKTDDTDNEEISPVTSSQTATDKLKGTTPAAAPASPSVRERFGAMLGNFIDKIPLTRHSFSMNSDNDSDANAGVSATGTPSKKKTTSGDLNQTLDKNFKMTGGTPKKQSGRVSDVKEVEEEEEDVPDSKKISPKKSHLERFMDRVPPKGRQSMPAKEEVESSPKKSPKSSSSALNKSLDKNFKAKNDKNQSTQEDDKLSVGSLSLDEDDDDDDQEENVIEEEEVKEKSPLAKKNHLSVFSQKTSVSTRHSIVTTTTTTVANGSPAKVDSNLNKSLSKDFKSKAADRPKKALELDDEEPMDIDLVASSESDEDEVHEINTSVDDKSPNKSVAKTPVKEVSPKKTPVKTPTANVSPRKSLKEFREEEKNKEEEDGDNQEEENAANVSTKDDMIRQILEKTIQDSIQKQIEEDGDEEEDSSDDEADQPEEKKAESPVTIVKTPKKETPKKDTPAKTPKKETPVKQESPVVVASPEKKVATPVKKSPKKAATEVVPKEEDSLDSDDQEDEGEEEEEEDDSGDDDSDNSDDGSVCKFEMEDVVEDGQEEKDEDSSDDEDDQAAAEPEEDVVINTRKLKTDEPATKVSDILNKCQSFLVSKTTEKKEARTVDEEKRQRKKEQKDAKQKKRAAEMARREELMAKQAAQKQLVDRKNVNAVLTKKKDEKRAKKQTKEDNFTVTEEVAKKVTNVTEKKQKDVKKAKQPTAIAIVKGANSDKSVIKKLDNLFASNVEKKPQQDKKENDPPKGKKQKKKTLKILQATSSASEMAATLQKPKNKGMKRQGDDAEDEYVPKKKPNLIPDKKYHQLAKDQKKEQNRLKDESKRAQGKPLKTVVKEPLRVLPKPVFWTPAGEFEVEDALSSPEKTPVKVKKGKTSKRLAQTNGTDFQVEVLNEAGVGVNGGKGNFKEQFQSRKNIRREESHALLKRRKFH